MTTRKDALQELLAKVEAGANIKRSDVAVTGLCKVKTLDAFENAYNGSLDAAKALHEAVLPDYWWCNVDPNGSVLIQEADKDGVRRTWKHHSHSGACEDNPARAWLIAIIKALIAKEPT